MPEKKLDGLYSGGSGSGTPGPQGPPGPPGTGTYVSESPNGTIDGSNQVFTLTHLPIASESVFLFLNGLFQRPSIEYNIIDNIITFVLNNQPLSGDNLWSIYIM